jgi:hypothetical protein
MLVKRKDGTFGHTDLCGNDARITFDPTFSYGSWDVYRPDGLYAKKVGTFATREAAETFIAIHGWNARGLRAAE